MCFTGYAVLITVRGLWAGPYLAEMFAFSPVARGNVLLAMSVAMILGNLAYGMLERRFDRRRRPVADRQRRRDPGPPAAGGTGPPRPPCWPRCCWPSIGALGMTYALLMAQGRRFLAEHEIGRGLTVLNCACFAGAATMQALSGLVVDLAQPFGPDRHLARAVPVPGGSPGSSARHLPAQPGSAPRRRATSGGVRASRWKCRIR